MLEKLLQAIAITLLMALFAGIGTPKPKEVPNPFFHAFSLPLLNLGSLN
ncbi:hypothetical protein [Leptolyngbya sp. NIES-2104]|nr:hypothetical protein [Leptolyngbya sp. NIES-2104]GAP95585.1 hypothetical protein NIES2104_21090 [Leptolyngbya sp. NIES-2104]